MVWLVICCNGSRIPERVIPRSGGGHIQEANLLQVLHILPRLLLPQLQGSNGVGDASSEKPSILMFNLKTGSTRGEGEN